MKGKAYAALLVSRSADVGTIMFTAVRIAALSTVLAAGVVAQGHAQDASRLQGKWVTTGGNYLFWNRETLDVPKDVAITVDIDTRDYPSLFITMTEEFAPDAFAGWHGAEQIQGKKTFNAIGVVSSDGRQIHMADVDDTTRWFCDLREGDALECLATEPGPRALAGRITLQKKNP